ncbi:MAG TPA: hypothetical protein DCP03_22390 [Polaromonas sp.]|nr:hypothetical protein [Polaromonas sp.]
MEYMHQHAARAAATVCAGRQRDPRQRRLVELNQLKSRAEKISVPLSYADELYALRNNLQLVRNKLQRL